MAQNILAGSPLSGSGSPSSPGGEKKGRAQAKKEFKDEVDELIQAVKLLPYYYKELSKMGNRNDKFPVQFTHEGRSYTYQVGRREVKELERLIIAGLKKLPTSAFTLNKTRRRTAPNSGFLAPAQFKAEIVNFFAGANIGNVVNGNFVEKQDKSKNKKAVPDAKSLVVTNTRLNNVLYFTQPRLSNGQDNLLYSIISPGTLTPLFALHAYYSGMQQQDATRLSASQQMREALNGVMQQTINNDVANLMKVYNDMGNPQMAQQVQATGQQLIQAIGNPSLQVNSVFNVVAPDGTQEKEEIFNPNYFLYAHFSKLISNGKVPFVASSQYPTWDSYLNSIRPSIPQNYAGVEGIETSAFQRVQAATPQGQTPAFENVVLQYQQNRVALSRAYKNREQQAEQRKKKAADKAREKAAQQLQMGPQLQGFQPGLQTFQPGLQTFQPITL